MIFPGFPVFPVQEIDHFSCFPAGNSNTRKCATLLVMLISSLKLKGKDFDVMAIVGTDSIRDPICKKSSQKHGLNYCGAKGCEESELIYDLKTKHLGNFDHLKDVQPISFEKACKGT